MYNVIFFVDSIVRHATAAGGKPPDPQGSAKPLNCVILFRSKCSLDSAMGLLTIIQGELYFW